jgi:hypothetical protein
MKMKMYGLSVFLTLSFMHSAYAYKYIIYTDESATNTSEKVAELMKKTYPFNTLNIEVEIVRVSSEELGCKSSLGIDRLITCDNVSEIQKRAVERGGDQAMIVKNLPKYGGSSGVGGGVPVITNYSNPRVMLHEYMHTLGLCDEYEYSKNEAAIFCKDIKNSPNIAFIQPLPGYGSDEEARALHASAIPWFSDIVPTTPITNSNKLGTGVVDPTKKVYPNETNMASAVNQTTGLYQGKVCNNLEPRKFSWHPGGGATIMENVNAGLGAPLEKVVKQILIGRGATNKMQITEPDDNNDSSISDAGSRAIAQSEPPAQVNNSGRNIFKSFFGWLTDMFQNIGRALTR